MARLRLQVALLVPLLWGCSATVEPEPQPRSQPAAGLPERHVRWDPLLGQGGTPTPDQYPALAAEGYAALLCVDGDAPDAQAAESAGLAVYHMPIGYGSISRWAMLSILRAAQAAPGAVYVYCQHGRHRGPAAAALIRMDRGVARDDALEGLLRSVNPHYAGLIDSVQAFDQPNLATVESVDVPPASVPPLPLGMAMDRVDEHYTALKDGPTAELAALLHQDFKEAARHTDGDLALDLAATADEAAELAALIDAGVDDALLDRVAAFAERCVHCHGLRR